MSGAGGPVRPDVEKVLSGLKDFQRATVDHVHSRFFDDADPTDRMLVADEVGLGKTLVARGVIAKAVDAMWDSDRRIDVIYVCSNQQIAAQNVRKLRVVAGQSLDHVDRLTMLPGRLGSLDEKYNFVSFTPGTSFDMGSSTGRAAERGVLWRLLENAWGPDLFGRVGATEVLRGNSRADRFKRSVEAAPQPEGEIQSSFEKQIEAHDRASGGPTLQEWFEELVEEGRGSRRRQADHFRYGRLRFLSQARALVARSCIDALEPDLIILDEFQRFTHLLDTRTPAGELASLLFNYREPGAAPAFGRAKTLLLSATPFRMYTLPDEPEGDDHYRDFRHTVEFLADDPRRTERIMTRLHDMREALHDSDELGRAIRDEDDAGALSAKRDVEGELRRFIVRTERLSTARSQGSMLSEVASSGVELEADDLQDYLVLTGTSGVLTDIGLGAAGAGPSTMLEYWRSSPYVLNFMQGYRVKQKFHEALAEHPGRMAEMLAEPSLLPADRVEAYQNVPLRNAKLRALHQDVMVGSGAELLWLPPSLRYHELSGAYDREDALATKRLVFSSWAMVPRAVATLLSYEVEQGLFHGEEGLSYSNLTSRRSSPLRFPTEERPGSMMLLAMLYPLTGLAELGDPLDVAKEHGVGLPMPRAELEDRIRSRISTALEEIRDQHSDSGTVDDNWYWAAPFLLEQRWRAAQDRIEPLLEVSDFLVPPGEAADDDESEPPIEDAGLRRHLEVAADVAARSLGRPPEDLLEVLTLLALAGPGVCALRSLGRVARPGDPAHITAEGSRVVRAAAARIAWGLRSLFSRPESVEIVRNSTDEQQPHWLRVLRHSADGGLQAVLDEHVHVLPEALGVVEDDPGGIANAVAERIGEALMLDSSRIKVDDIRVIDDDVRVESQPMRQRFAARFGADGAETEQGVQRAEHVQSAFNSPFWPFVLVSTSVGQEGLDFHWWCHAVVHWNLPHNPVDLEQREGRIHRYKGHAVRRNLAAEYGSDPAVGRATDPWRKLFELGVQHRAEGDDDLVPFWMFPREGGATIERHAPVMPLSRESKRLVDLKRTLAAYRLTIGQPRQEDLVAYLQSRYTDEEIAGLAERLRIDLRPGV